jgi:YD repeat-containing protein
MVDQGIETDYVERIRVHDQPLQNGVEQAAPLGRMLKRINFTAFFLVLNVICTPLYSAIRYNAYSDAHTEYRFYEWRYADCKSVTAGGKCPALNQYCQKYYSSFVNNGTTYTFYGVGDDNPFYANKWHCITIPNWSGSVNIGDYQFIADCPSGTSINTTTGQCENTKNPPGNLCSSTPKPINLLNGNKYLDLQDYPSGDISPITFTRHYNSFSGYHSQNSFGSLSLSNKPLGLAWVHNYYYGLMVGTTETKLTRNNGQTFGYRLTNNTWVSDPDINYQLIEIKDAAGTRTGWTVTAPDKTVESYDASGNLLTITQKNGLAQTLKYSCSTVNASCPVATPTSIAPYAGLLIKVTDNFGNSLNFTYNATGQMATMTDPAGNVSRYSYDTSGNLKTVTYPDDTPAVLSDNPKTTYIYGTEAGETANVSATPNPGVDYSHSLTGVIDENGVRTMTYQYDASGRAYNEFHSGNIDKYTLAYAPDGSSTSVTDPLGSVRTTRFTTVLGVVKATGTDQPGGSGCAEASSAMTYDVNGNVASRTGFSNPGYDGHKTCYAYDMARNLETARVEGLSKDADCAAMLSATSLPAPARKVTTSWHPTYRLPMKVAEPKRLTTYTRDAQGNVLTKTEQATTDLSGVAGLTPTIAPGTLARTWAYTYNALGQVLTANGPRTDVSDITTYTYHPDTDPVLGNRGNIKDITNPLGQKTTFNGYDGNGRLTQMTAPNGVVTTMAYTPRGWLKALTVKDSANALVQTTGYTYDPTGLLKTVTAPDGSVLTYGYDPAHRLTSVTDSLGNKVTYTLDAIGNRIAEKATDPTNVLRRNITRVYDALNRLQTVTGAGQ